MKFRSFSNKVAIGFLAGTLSLLGAEIAYADASSQSEQSTIIDIQASSGQSTNQVQVSTQSSSSTQIGQDVAELVTSDSVITGNQQDTSSVSRGLVSLVDDSINPDNALSKLDTNENSDPKVASTTSSDTEVVVTPAVLAQEHSIPVVAIPATYRKYSALATVDNDFIPDLVTSEAPQVPATTEPSSSNAPHIPAGNGWQQISVALRNIVMPTTLRLQPIVPAHNLFMPRIMLPQLIVIILLLLIGTIFVNLLRRSGFSHAPRSDQSASFYTFATQPKVSFAWADSPVASSSFYDARMGLRVRNTKTNQCYKEGGE